MSDVRCIYVSRPALEARNRSRRHLSELAEDPPVFIVRFEGEEHTTARLELTGPAEGVYRDSPLGGKGGPRAWLETTSPVITDEGPI